MNHRDIAGVMTAAAPAFRDYVVRAVSPLVDRLLAVEKFVRDLQIPKDGKDADPEVIAKMVSAEVSRILPEAVSAEASSIKIAFEAKEAELRTENDRLSVFISSFERRFDELSDSLKAEPIYFTELKGKFDNLPQPKDVDYGEIERVVTEKVEKAVSAFPVPENGKDADPAHVEMLVRLVVGEEVGKIDRPKDGKDADPEVIEQLVKAEVAKIEPPKDGKSIDPADVEAMVGLTVEKAVAALPPALAGKDGDPGKSIDIEDLLPVIAERVDLAVAAIAYPKDGEPGADGKSVTVDDVRPLLEEMVAALPPAQNGRGADPEVIRSMIVEEVAKIDPPKDGEPGADGKSVQIDELIPAIAAEVIHAVSLIAPPKDGERGADGKSVTIEDVRPLIDQVVAALPPAAAGKDADPEVIVQMVAAEVSKTLESWPRPADGTSVTLDDVRPVLKEMVAALPPAAAGKDADPAEVAALIIEDVAKLIPVPADGKSVSVDDVLPAIQEMVAKAVSALPVPKNGRDGVGVAGAILDRAGELVLTFSDGSTKSLGIIVGKDADPAEIVRMINEKFAEIPVPKDGLDGLGFEDLDVEFDGERTISLKFTRGDHVKEFAFKMPVVLDRGVFKDVREKPYERGDGVTFGGSFWIAQKDAPEGKPQDGSKDWRLSVKRGRNGTDGVVKTVPPQGPVKSS